MVSDGHDCGAFRRFLRNGFDGSLLCRIDAHLRLVRAILLSSLCPGIDRHLLHHDAGAGVAVVGPYTAIGSDVLFGWGPVSHRWHYGVRDFLV